jgi:hypothetical protein
MRNLYLVLEKVNEYLSAHPLINNVSFGDIDDIDLRKQTIFPLAHVIVRDAQFQGQYFNTVVFTLDILVMDIVDVDKNDIRTEVDPFYGQDNLQDVLNSTLVVLNSLTQDLVKGDLYTEMYQIDGPPSCVPFLDRFENKLAGWLMTLTIKTANNEITIC